MKVTLDHTKKPFNNGQPLIVLGSKLKPRSGSELKNSVPQNTPEAQDPTMEALKEYAAQQKGPQ